MTWYVEFNESNQNVQLRFVDDSGAVHGPRNVDWPDAPAIDRATDGWPTDPNVKQAVGEFCTDLHTDVSPTVGFSALCDLAAGEFKRGKP